MFTFERLFVSDLRRDGLIPAALLGHPPLAALEAERARLAAALEEAERGGGRRDVAAADDALVHWGDTLRRTVAAEVGELQAAAQARVQARRDEAAELLRQANAAQAKARAAEQLGTWLRRCAAGEVYYPTFATAP
ncbi:MAG: hypothetical protein M3Q47_18705 [Actinomycetota bacterium]|nr:hypothetical protein [Actinomycetota bacterium]